MMRWQELKDDLRYWRSVERWLEIDDGQSAAHRVAGRVLALYQPCDKCEGTGKTTRVADCPDRERLRKTWGEGVSCCVDHREIVPCSRCGGTGIVPTEKGWDKLGGATHLLADYLFGEGNR